MKESILFLVKGMKEYNMEKINDKIVLVRPHQKIIELIWDVDNLIIFDNFGWWDVVNGRKNIIEKKKINVCEVDSKISIKDMVDYMRKWGPILSRWNDCGDQFELILRDMMIQSIATSHVLKKLNIKYAFFQTGVSHHLDSVVFEYACSLASVKQIFLYAETFRGRLLPLVQEHSILDRKPLSIGISNYDYSKDIQSLIDHKLNDKPLDLNHVAKKEKIYAYAVTKMTWRAMKSVLRRLIRKNKEEYTYFPYSLSSHLRQLSQQRKALKFYKNNEVTVNYMSNSQNFNNDVDLLIMAHQQPEATSFPEGGRFNNHIDIVLELRRRGYSDTIYYKEHPGTFQYFNNIVVGHLRIGMCRSTSYYKQLLDLGCKFVSTDYFFSLDNSHFLPITITGTIAIERSLSGLNTIVLGEPWFKGMPGLHGIDSLTHLLGKGEMILKSNHEISKQSLLFLKNILNNNTLTNIIGVGTGKEMLKDNDKVFKKELLKLISYLL
jgi:hypothetical protein